MKRIITSLLCLAMASSTVILPAQAEEKYENKKAENVLMNMGIISKEDYSPDADVTRGEFASIIVDMLRIGDPDRQHSEWEQNVLGEDTTTGEVEVKKNIFTDVDESHPYCYEIELVKKKGIMNGVSDTKFAPEYGITLREVTKVIADLAGYSKEANIEGGYPAGYEAVVRNIDLTKNLSSDFNDVITKSEIAQVIYNAFDVQLMEFKMQGGLPSYMYGDETFLTGVMNMNVIRGTVTDNGYACLSGDSYIGKGKIAIDGLELILPEEFTFATEFIGQEVEAYYTNDLEEKNYITSIELVDEKVITFDLKDFEDYTGTSISYLKNGRVVTEQVNKNSKLILNNKYEKIWDESVFAAPNGTVTLIAQGGKEYNMLVITSYEYALVSSIDYEERIIYNRLKGKDITDKYELPEETDDKGVFIEDESGKTLKFTEIAKGDSLGIINSDNYMKVIVKKNPAMNISFTAKTEEDGRKIYSSGEETYAMSKFYNKLSVKIDANLSKLYTVYLNNFNEIIFIEVADVETKGQTTGVLTRAFSGDTDEQDNLSFIRVYGEDGKMKKYTAKERINFNGETKKFKDIATALENSIGSVILFSLDEEEQVTEIVVPGAFSSTKETGWYEIAELNTYYYGNGKDINNLFFVNADTLIYTIPDDPAHYGSEEYFTVNSMSFSSGKQYTDKLTAYGRNKDNVYADVLVIEQDAGSGTTKNGRISEEHMFLITEISDALNGDEIPTKILKGYEFGWRMATPVYKEYVVNEEAIMIDVGNPGNKIDATKPISEVGPRTYDELSAGDAIYYGKNIKDELTVIRTAFDYDQKKTFLGGRETTTTYTFTTNTPWYGGVISLYGDGIKIATNDVKSPESPAKTPDKINYNDFSEVSKYVVSHVLVPAKIVVVEEGKKGKFTARIGSLNDIVTYNESGAYSNVLISTNWQSAVYATVIYK